MKKVICILLCFAIVISLSCCSVSSAISLTMGVIEGINTFDPILAQTGTEKLLFGNCFEGLLRFDSEGKPALAGATGYTIGKNGLSYTFKLNPEAHFFVNKTIEATFENLNIENFETNIKAADYIFGFNRFIDSNPNAFPYIKKISSADDYTLEITLKSTDIDFLYKLASYPIFPCRKEFFEKCGDIYGTMPTLILTNGPYYIESSTQSETILTKNKNYKGNIQILNKQVTLYTTGTTDALLGRFSDGSYDFYIGDKSVTPENATSTFSHVNEIWGIVFNCKSPMGKVKSLRTAFTGTVDYGKLSAPDFADNSTNHIIPGNFILGDSNYSDFANSDIEFKTDIQKSKKAVDNYLTKNKSEKIEINFAIPEGFKKCADIITESWMKIYGNKVSVTIAEFPLADAQQIADEGKYDIAVLPLNYDNYTAKSLLNSFKNSPAYYENETLYKSFNSYSPIPSDNFAYCQKAEEVLISNGIFYPLFNVNKYLYLNTGVKGIYMADGGNLVYFYGGAKG